ncbi:winged helix family transcriptional regulator [Streptomyces tateyamensis]|uniref:Winged helix family transcriptional regulator n=1 Tax=Streptomyces tateyamensis TaxID=565073 RepID=A0A2V4N258_9ACTN|nr:winged helix-turn-helix domain-containing protein [Streptomyces tateyamensis]PYC76827.1 winged helix family transcriptional regulator [Streptomyces tateyamensis]
MSSSTAILTPPLLSTPHLRPVPNPPLQLVPDAPIAPELHGSLPDGATVVAALPPSALAQYGAPQGDRPMVGYLVLVPAAAPEPAAGPVAAPTPSPHGISVDPDRRTAHVDGELLDLTYLEFELLAHLTQHPQRVHTRDQLVSTVWGYGHVGDGRTVDVHVARLRRKLGAGHRASIVTVRRVGYKYVPFNQG